jgi:hypothetical protein
MLTKTFEAEVRNGQLHCEEPLEALEGQRVQVTVTVPEPAAQTANGQAQPVSEEPPEWLDVEKDIYVPMPFRGEILKDVRIVEGGPLEPCIIVPEELPDE